jgi:hypothetical protein
MKTDNHTNNIITKKSSKYDFLFGAKHQTMMKGWRVSRTKKGGQRQE